MGNVVSAGVGQNPARQAALGGGLDERVASTTVNKVCGSGLKTVMLASQGIIAGDFEIAVAGGMESMSNCPTCCQAREGLRLGHGEVTDSLIHDGLWCAFENRHMGLSGEAVAPSNTASAARNRTRSRPKAITRPPPRRGRLVQGRNRPGADPAAQRPGGRVRSRRSGARGYDRRRARRR